MEPEGGWARRHPDFEMGNEAARTHGVWAADVDDEALEVVGALFASELVDRYPAMALVGAQAWVRRRRALADIEARGMVIDEKPHPLLRYVHQWERTLLDLSQRFGLDPRSDYELRRAQVDATRGAFDLDAALAAGRATRALEVPPEGS